jgi:hypothetical protein
MCSEDCPLLTYKWLAHHPGSVFLFLFLPFPTVSSSPLKHFFTTKSFLRLQDNLGAPFYPSAPLSTVSLNFLDALHCMLVACPNFPITVPLPHLTTLYPFYFLICSLSSTCNCNIHPTRTITSTVYVIVTLELQLVGEQ